MGISMPLKLLGLMACSSLLMACGGGGDSNTDNGGVTPPPPHCHAAQIAFRRFLLPHHPQSVFKLNRLMWQANPVPSLPTSLIAIAKT